jgi:hypothetical protein
MPASLLWAAGTFSLFPRSSGQRHVGRRAEVDRTAGVGKTFDRFIVMLKDRYLASDGYQAVS